MSYNVAYKQQQDALGGYFHELSERYWYALLDRNGKVRDWVASEWGIGGAKRLFTKYRDYGRIPKGYTVERRGPVTRENW